MGIGAAAMISAIALSFSGQGAMKPLLKLVCGLILAFAILNPILSISAGNLEALGMDYREQAEAAARQGQQQAVKSVREIIKEETEAYILDKAGQLNLQVEVQVSLSDQALPKPLAVTIRGVVPPSGKTRLSRILTQQLGIAKENQTWIS